eukprot:2584501-Prymnesium_polylepis.1
MDWNKWEVAHWTHLAHLSSPRALAEKKEEATQRFRMAMWRRVKQQVRHVWQFIVNDEFD